VLIAGPYLSPLDSDFSLALIQVEILS